MINLEYKSAVVIECLLKDYDISEEMARTAWFNSKTYKKLISQRTVYKLPLKVYRELQEELSNDPSWVSKHYCKKRV